MYPPLVYTLLMAVIGMVISTFLALWGAPLETIVSSSMWSTGMAAACMIPLAISMVERDNRMRCPKLQYRSRMKLPDVIWMLGLGASLAYVLNFLLIILQVHRLFPSYTENFTPIIENNSMGVTIICMAILGPIAEEWVFRGLVHRRLRDYLGKGWGILLSSIIFGAVHGNMAQFLYAFLMGVILAWFMEYFQSLAAPILLHTAANFWSFVLSFYQEELAYAGGGFLLLLIVAIQFTIVILSAVYLGTSKTARKNRF